MRITLRAKGQLTLPEAIRKAARLAEGDLLEAEDGTVILRPVTTVDRSQAWFWQADHQAGEREASEQSARDEGESFGSGREFLASLE